MNTSIHPRKQTALTALMLLLALGWCLPGSSLAKDPPAAKKDSPAVRPKQPGEKKEPPAAKKDAPAEKPAGGKKRKTKDPAEPVLPPIDLNHPPREYVQRKIQDWPLLVEKELLDAQPGLAEKAIGRLDRNLVKMMEILPPHTHERMRKLKLFLMYGEKAKLGGRDNGAEYFQPRAPKHFPNVDPRMASSVVIYSAQNYTELSKLWALKVVFHEFAHAWQLEQWPEKQKDILAAYKNAMQRGLYHKNRGLDKRTDKRYATYNQLEYFAELSCMYFVGCDYYPYTRADLKQYDPDGYQMICKMWRVEEPEKKESEVGTRSNEKIP